MAYAEADVIVLGLGPAGRSLVSRLMARGVDVVGIDLHPDRRWRPTYAVWAHEVPDWLPKEAIASTSELRAFALTEHRLPEPFVVFDTPALQRALTVDAARIITARIVEVVDPHTVRLGDSKGDGRADGREVTADVIVDARGTRPAATKAVQSAVGVMLPADRTGSIEGSWFMDWRTDNGAETGAPPSFLYVVPVSGDRVLVEETCLVGRPPLGYEELGRRLRARLTARGVELRGDEQREYVRFPVEPQERRNEPELIAIGAGGGIMHPATGYSVGPSLQLADELAAALVSAPDQAADLVAGRRQRQVRFLRQAGLSTLLELGPAEIPAFFEAFFALPPPALQQAYLTARDRPLSTSAAMARMALSLSPRLSALAVRATLRSAFGSASGAVSGVGEEGAGGRRWQGQP